jgi:hypothetical protein
MIQDYKLIIISQNNINLMTIIDLKTQAQRSINLNITEMDIC